MTYLGTQFGVETWRYMVLDALTAPEGTRVGDELLHRVYLPFVPLLEPEPTKAGGPSQ